MCKVEGRHVDLVKKFCQEKDIEEMMIGHILMMVKFAAWLEQGVKHAGYYPDGEPVRDVKCPECLQTYPHHCADCPLARLTSSPSAEA